MESLDYLIKYHVLPYNLGDEGKLIKAIHKLQSQLTEANKRVKNYETSLGGTLLDLLQKDVDRLRGENREIKDWHNSLVDKIKAHEREAIKRDKELAEARELISLYRNARKEISPEIINRMDELMKKLMPTKKASE